MFVTYNNCAFFHLTNVNQMLRRVNHTNLLFPPPSHPPMHPPPLHPPPLHNLQQRLTKLETKFMESTTKLNSKIKFFVRKSIKVCIG